MNKTEVILPAMGEGIIEATITRWLVNIGDYVHEDDSLLEVATDKVDSEISAPCSGVIARIIYREGEIPKVGEVLAIIETDRDNSEEKAETKRDTIHETPLNIDVPRDAIVSEPVIAQKSVEQIKSTAGSDRFITPYIRFFAKNRGISIDELRKIKGTGLGGRITKADLNAYIVSGRSFAGSGSETVVENTIPKTLQS